MCISKIKGLRTITANYFRKMRQYVCSWLNAVIYFLLLVVLRVRSSYFHHYDYFLCFNYMIAVREINKIE